MKFIKVLYLFLLLFSVVCFAKRVVPIEVAPISYETIEYSTVPWAYENGTNQNGGYVRAKSKITGKVIWEKQIYITKYRQNIERDVQDVFITSLKIIEKDNVLLVETESGERFRITLDTQYILKIE